LDETAPDCSVGNFGDLIQASGTDRGLVGGKAAHSVSIAPCSPTPANARTR
jgi:hypothetical protein